MGDRSPRGGAPTLPAPRITALMWGRIDTEAGSFRDAKLWPGGGRNWDWGETGTHHIPGIQPTDVAELVEHGAVVLVLGRGQQERLHVTEEAIAAAAEGGASCEALPTTAAVDRYNQLAERRVAVGALIHSTC